MPFNRTGFAGIIALSVIVFAIGCKKQEMKLSEKSKKLFGKAWIYDTEATRTSVLTKTGEATGIKNLKDIRLKGDVKKMADALTARTFYIAPDKKGRGIGYNLATGKGILQSKNVGWLEWNSDETKFTLKPTKKNYKPKTFTVIEISPNKLVILDDASSTKTAEVYTR